MANNRGDEHALLCAGFCGETDEEHAATVELMRSTKYDAAFMFAYSQREKTSAARHLQVRGAHGGRNACMYVQRETTLVAVAAPQPAQQVSSWWGGKAVWLMMLHNLKRRTMCRRQSSLRGCRRSSQRTVRSSPPAWLLRLAAPTW